jgi:WD40 repeat protein
MSCLPAKRSEQHQATTMMEELMQPGLLVLLLMALAPLLFAAYLLTGKAPEPETIPKTSSTKPSTTQPQKSIPKVTKATKAKPLKPMPNQKYSKKKKLAPPKHPRFVGWVKGHSSNVLSCAISPDGQFFAASCNDRSLRVTRLSDCLKIPGQRNTGSNPPMYMSTPTNYTTLSAICWVGKNSGAIVVGVQDSDRHCCYFRCKPKKQANTDMHGGALDLASEKKKLEGELLAHQDIYTKVSKKLRNDNYVTNAPQATIASERKKMAEAQNNVLRTKESIAILINRAKSDSKKSFKYELKWMQKKGFPTNLMDTCQFIAMDQVTSAPTIVLGFSDGATSLRTCVYSLEGKELCAFKTKPGLHVKQKGYAIGTSKDNALIAVSLCSNSVGIHKQEASTGMSRKPVMQLSSCHTLRVTDVALGSRASSGVPSDTDRCVVCSGDGTWSLWKIDVQYKFKEEPVLLYQSAALSSGGLKKIAISPNGRRVVVVGGENGNALWIFSLENAGIHDSGTVTLVDTIDIGHPEGAINALMWGPDSTYVACATKASKIVYLWGVRKK